ncbi:MAG: carotenoid oxygenase family protein [Acidimicrobiales bacterium]
MTNRYLEGNFAPVREELTVTELPVTGRIPDYLDGRYLRNGPNPVVDPDPETYTWFFGAGMVHGVRLRDGRAEWYRNRWVRSADVARALGEKWRKGSHRGGADFASNTNVVGHAGKTLAIVEGGARPYELTEELDTVGPSDFGGTLRGGYTAHPHRDPATGELHAVSYSPFWGNHVRYTVTGTDGRVRRTVPIEVTGRPMMHDFSLTAEHVVFYDLPVAFDASTFGRIASRVARWGERRALPQLIESQLMRLSNTGRVSGANLPMPYRWNPEYPARVGVMPRNGDGSSVRWFDVEPCYVYHPLNSYDEDGDEGGRIVLDVIRHPKTFVAGNDPYGGQPTFDRWTVDLAAGKVIEERLDDRGQEFPRHDERLTGRRHRYGYAAGFIGDDVGFDFADALLKHDLAGGRTATRSFGAGTKVGEFVFVPSALDATEDEGVLMGFVHNEGTGRTDLVLVDAATLDDVATVHLPTRVPYGFHGNWIPT